jgi:hypothetical protein
VALSPIAVAPPPLGSRIFRPRCRAILQIVLDGLGLDEQDSDPIQIPVSPKTATVHKNAYRLADSYELTFDAYDLPFDPKLVRTGFIEVYLYRAPSDDADDRTRIASRQDPFAGPSRGELAQQEANLISRERFVADERPIVAGLFDSHQLELSEGGKWVSIRGQDLTADLAARQWKPNPNGTARRIPTGQRIDDLFHDLLEEADSTGRIGLDVRGIEDSVLPIVGKGDVRGARGITIEQGTSYWDVMTKVAQRCGLICFVDGVDVVLSRPKTLDDALIGNVKSLAWGRNVEHLTLERQLGKVQVPTVVVVGYDERERKPIRVEYPPNSLDRERVFKPSGGKIRGTTKQARETVRIRAKPPKPSKKGKTQTIRKKDDYQILTVDAPTDRATLEQVAKNHFHEVGRGERRVIAKTRDLVDTEGRDMLGLTAGDAVSIAWDELDHAMLSSDIPAAAKADALVARGWNRFVANELVEYHEHLIAVDRPLRVQEATYTFDAEQGLDIELDLQDFIVVDGIRDDDDSASALRQTRRGDRRIKQDGTPLGWGRDRENDLKRRHRP